MESVKWDLEDQGLGQELDAQDAKNLDDVDDEVFLCQDDYSVPANISLLKKSIPAASPPPHPPPPPPVAHPTETTSPRSPQCSVQWSVSHRCMDCAWQARRGGRPRHPSPTLFTQESVSPPLVTLQSLGTTRDSGYEPSPTSGFSFTFTSDDEGDDLEEEEDDEKGSDNTLGVDNTPVSTGVTPPISIPSNGPEGGRLKVFTPRVPQKHKVSVRDKWNKCPPKHKPSLSVSLSSPLTRSKSMPELWASERVLFRTPIVIRSGDFFKDQQQVSNSVQPVHGRNYSLPVTTPDGRPVLTPTTTPTHVFRSSREGLIDLTDDEAGGNSRHHRRVLVWALPDLLVDLASLRGEGSPLSSPSILSPSARSSSSTTSKDTIGQTPSSIFSKSPRRPPAPSSVLQRSLSGSSTPSETSVGDVNPSGRERCRATWRRPRALSCDVTLEVEFGQELRKVADEFSRTYSNWEGGVWHVLKNSIGRRFSFGSCPTAQDEERSPVGVRTSHSFPPSPNRPSEGPDGCPYY